MALDVVITLCRLRVRMRASQAASSSQAGAALQRGPVEHLDAATS